MKAVSRGMILHDFTYLRDVWNWLDFVVVGLACVAPFSFLHIASLSNSIPNHLNSVRLRYMMFAIPILGNMSALKSLRVLRALKTITVARGTPSLLCSALPSFHPVPVHSLRLRALHEYSSVK